MRKRLGALAIAAALLFATPAFATTGSAIGSVDKPEVYVVVIQTASLAAGVSDTTRFYAPAWANLASGDSLYVTGDLAGATNDSAAVSLKGGMVTGSYEAAPIFADTVAYMSGDDAIVDAPARLAPFHAYEWITKNLGATAGVWTFRIAMPRN